MKLFVPLTLLCGVVVIAGCSSTATVGRLQTSNFYERKIPATALVVIPASLQTKKLDVAITTEACGGWTAQVDAGLGFTTAIFSGLTAAIETVQLVDTLPSPEQAALRGADLLINVVPAGESASITATEGSGYPTLAAQFHSSVDVTISDAQGARLFRFAANGTGFHNIAGPCNIAATTMQTAVEMALKQISDWIAQSVHGMSVARRK